MTYKAKLQGLSDAFRRPLTYVLLGIFGIALSLRLWGIAFGLPYDFTPDEVHEIVRALKLGTGEYSWNAYGKGGLYLFLFVEYGFLFVWWWMTGWVSGPTEFAFRYVEDPTAFYLLGRITVAIMGALTCLVLYAIGKRVHDWRAGVTAAFIGATAYFHAVWSHYINVDIGTTLALWSGILAYLEYERTGRTRWLITAGALGGVAIAFKIPGGIALPVLLLAIATPKTKWAAPRQLFREAAIVVLALLGTVALVSPENYVTLGDLRHHFSGLLSSQEASAAPLVSEQNIDDSISELVLYRGPSYFTLLVTNANIALTIAAALGAAISVWRRDRWDIIWCVLIVTFLGVMTLADRGGEERYMLPIVPALWLLAARAVMVIAGQRVPLAGVLVAAIVALPVFELVRQNYMFTRPDTRVLAKQWIEGNVPSGAKILMDGMEYRFNQSPPLVPDDSTVARTVSRGTGGRAGSRGISDQTLDLYSQAMARITGPRYELHSTVWGLAVQDLAYYPQECFDYIVTSSAVAQLFLPPSDAESHPLSLQFYQQLPTDQRFERVYSVEPEPWAVQGPAITVYRVLRSGDHVCS